MKLSELTEEQTVYILRQAEIGAPIRHRSSLEHLTASDFISQRQNENNRPPKTCSARFAQLSQNEVNVNIFAPHLLLYMNTFKPVQTISCTFFCILRH